MPVIATALRYTRLERQDIHTGADLNGPSTKDHDKERPSSHSGCSQPRARGKLSRQKTGSSAVSSVDEGMGPTASLQHPDSPDTEVGAEGAVYMLRLNVDTIAIESYR